MKLYYNIILIILMISIMNLNFASAEVESLPTQKQYSIVNIPQTCSNCSYVNITKIKYPNSSEIYPSIAMSSTNNINYYYSFNETKETGRYIVTTCGDVDGVLTCVDFDFLITQNVEDMTLASIFVGPVLLLIIAILFLITAITFNNQRWVVKSVLFLLATIFILMSINSGLGYVINTKNYSMLSNAFTVAIAAISLLFILLIVYYLKSLANALKQVKSEKKEDLL